MRPPAVHEDRGEEREEHRHVVDADDGRRPVSELADVDRIVAGGAPHGELARHEAVLGGDRREAVDRHRPAVRLEHLGRSVLRPDEDGEVDGDQGDREDRAPARRNVVVERDHPAGRRPDSGSGSAARAAAIRSSASRSAATCVGNAVGPGAREHRAHRLADPLDARTRPVGVVRPAELLGDVDDAAGVDDEVWRVQDPPAVKLVAHRAVEKLVVRSARHDAAAKPGHGLGPDHRAERTGRVDVALQRVHRARVARLGAERDERLDPVGVDVGHRHARAGLEQVADDVAADVPGALHRHPHALELIADPRLLDRGPHAAHDAPRSHRRGVAGAALLHGQAGDVASLPGDDLGVGGRRADVLGRQVTAADRLDETTQRPEQELALLCSRVADHDRLPAPERESGGRVLVRHPP